MLRKLILTALLTVLYEGTPPQLGGSLLTIFLFLLVHVLVKPYVNQGLNVFQRLSLISQFLTVFASERRQGLFSAVYQTLSGGSNL